MTQQTDLSAGDIAEMLRANPLGLCQHLLPAGRKVGNYWCIGSINGEPGKTLKVRLSGPKIGTWVDYACADTDPAGKGDMLKLLQLTIANGDIAVAVSEAKRWLNIENLDPHALERQKERARMAAQKQSREADKALDRKRDNARRLFLSSSPCAASSPPVKYLAGRGIDLSKLGSIPRSIRFKPDMFHPELGRDRLQPAMMTCFCALSGEIVGVHVTFLEYRGGAWGKLSGVEDVKFTHGPAWQYGAHLPLWKGDKPPSGKGKLADIAPGTPVQVAEGIEDGLSYAMANPHARIVAAGTLGLIGQMRLPKQAGALNILAQRDTKPEPIAALEAAIANQQKAAQADQSERRVNCLWTPKGIKDWNDWLQVLQAEAAGRAE